MPINNHAVLLKGVNDSLATQRELCRALLRIKVRPYYLFHCDPVTGADHFRTPVWKGIEIIEGLRGHISGLGVPTYVVDAPRGGGKIPLMPNYLISASNDSVVLRNYEGMIIHYHPTGELPRDPSPVQTEVETQGVSGAPRRERRGRWIPEGNPRHARRPHALAAKRPHINGNGQAATGCQRRRRRIRERRRSGTPRRGTEARIEDRDRLRPRRPDPALRPKGRMTDSRSSTSPRPSRRSPRSSDPRGTRSCSSETAATSSSGSSPTRPISSSTSPRERASAGAGRPACRPHWRCSGIPYSGFRPADPGRAASTRRWPSGSSRPGTRRRRSRGDGRFRPTSAERRRDPPPPVQRSPTRIAAGEARGRRSPLILKPTFEGSSKGIRARCIAEDGQRGNRGYYQQLWRARLRRNRS